MRFRAIASRAALGTLVGAAAVIGAGEASAHHSFALFDTQKTVSLVGTVKRFEWTNPHSWIFLNVANADNVTEEWTIELPAAAALAGEGWNKNYLKEGDRISVMINPLKNGMKGGSLEGFTPRGSDPEP